MGAGATVWCDGMQFVEGSVRCTRSDGSTVELSWESPGRFSVVEVGPGRAREYVGTFDPSGEFRVIGLPAGATSTRTNAYGMAVEREEYPHLVVERAYDDDARPCRTTVTGDWGELSAELRTDGSRSVRWSISAIDVEQIIDADGEAGEVRMRRPGKEH